MISLALRLLLALFGTFTSVPTTVCVGNTIVDVPLVSTPLPLMISLALRLLLALFGTFTSAPTTVCVCDNSDDCFFVLMQSRGCSNLVHTLSVLNVVQFPTRRREYLGLVTATFSLRQSDTNPKNPPSLERTVERIIMSHSCPWNPSIVRQIILINFLLLIVIYLLVLSMSSHWAL